MVYPERARVWVMDADGIQVHEGPKELPWTENAADVLPNYPFITGERRCYSMLTHTAPWRRPFGVSNWSGVIGCVQRLSFFHGYIM